MGSSLRGCTALLIWLFVNYCLEAQPANVGIGVEDPTQKLSVDGAIQIGMNQEDSLQPGTIRWNPETSDFEGFTGYDWKSLNRGPAELHGVTNSTIIESGERCTKPVRIRAIILRGRWIRMVIIPLSERTSDDDEGFNAGCGICFCSVPETPGLYSNRSW